MENADYVYLKKDSCEQSEDISSTYYLAGGLGGQGCGLGGWPGMGPMPGDGDRKAMGPNGGLP